MNTVIVNAEIAIFEMFETLLKVNDFGIQDDFFDLGGHSLLATQLISRVADRFGIEIALKTFFESPTVESIAKRIDAVSGTAKNEHDSDVMEEFRF